LSQLRLLEKHGIRKRQRRWYVKHVDTFIKAQNGHRIKSLSGADRTPCLDMTVRESRLAGWQFSQCITALRIFCRELLCTPGDTQSWPIYRYVARLSLLHPVPMPTLAHWQHFPHQADMGVRGHGESLAQAFEQAALALTAVVSDPARVESRDLVEINCEAPEAEILLYDFLNSLVYEMAVGKRLFSRFEVRIEGDQLAARAWGEPVDVARHQPAVEVKGATFTQLKVEQQPDGHWIAQCVLDI
jgi:SHS2 domain-containing protein